MMERMRVTDDPANIGYYSGLVDSCFAVAQLMTVRTVLFSYPHEFVLISRAICAFRYTNGVNGQTVLGGNQSSLQV